MSTKKQDVQTEDKPELAPVPKPFFRDREAEEPAGRWENRCHFTRYITYAEEMVCDRPIGHKGLHTGRHFSNLGIGDTTSVIGWTKVRSHG